jgi:hypothetical protein
MKKVTPMKTSRVIGAALAAAAIYLPSARPAFADAAPEKGIVAFKYLNYKDSQPDQDRMHINAYTVRAMTPVAGKWAIDVTGTFDSVSGASPHYHSYFNPDAISTASSGMRRSIDLNVTRYFSTGSLTAGNSYSYESDYISRSISLQGSIMTPSKNTTITLGGSVTTDSINPTNGQYQHERKKTHAVLLGVTQVMSKNDIVQVNLSRSVGTGLFTDPYKPIDNRPGHHNYTTVMTRWNHYFESTEGVMKLSYRFYNDTYGIDSHTLGAEYFQPLPHGFTITPLVRYYSQSAASFYIPVNPLMPQDPPDINYDDFYSLDQRLSAFGAVTLGLKVTKRFAQDWLIDARYDHCMQRYDWGINGKGDPGLKPFNMNFFQLGISREF